MVIFPENQLKWLLSDLFIVGLDTTVTTLRWGLLFLVRQPDTQEKLYQEIDSVFSFDKKPS